MSDFRLANFVWYFTHYEKTFGQKTRNNHLRTYCMAEASRRGIDTRDLDKYAEQA